MGELSSVDLLWHGPFSFETLLVDQKTRDTFSGKPGVYLWVVNQPTGPRITYIGKASGRPDLIKRHLEHYRGYISGAYFIPAWALKSKTDWNVDPYNNEHVKSILFHRDKLCSFVAEAFDYTAHIQIFLARISPKHQAELHSIEKAMIYQEQPEENQRDKKSKPETEMQLHHRGETVWRQCSKNNPN